MGIKEKLSKFKKRKPKVNRTKKNTQFAGYTVEDIVELAELSGELKSIKTNPVNKQHANLYEMSKQPYLNDLVDEFINWYHDNLVKDAYSKIGEYNKPKQLRDFIEKMAVWYELRYPEYEINRLMKCSSQENKSVNEEMFINNPYLKNNEKLKDDFFNNSDSKQMDWSRFYNIDAFYNSLPAHEKLYLYKPTYPGLIYPNPDIKGIHLHLTKEGIVAISEGMNYLTNNKYDDKFFEGFHIKEVLQILLEEGITLPKNNEIKKAIRIYEERNYFYEELLNCVMYRIIERGGNRIGPRRGFMFAKEFKRNIDIPMMYGVDTIDQYLRDFINEYLKSGGNTDLICYENYFFKTKDYEKLDTTTIKKLLKLILHINKYKYTDEEKELQQTLAYIITKNINQEELKKEEIKQSRLIRKLKKSKQHHR